MPKSWKYLAILLVLVVPQRGFAQADSVDPDGYRLSEPVSHGNLAIYFIHGASRGGPVPLTLEEALQHKTSSCARPGRSTSFRSRIPAIGISSFRQATS